VAQKYSQLAPLVKKLPVISQDMALAVTCYGVDGSLMITIKFKKLLPCDGEKFFF